VVLRVIAITDMPGAIRHRLHTEHLWR